MKEKNIKSVVALVVTFLLFFVSDIRLPFLDSNADEYFESAMSKAAVAYGTTRVINASISILKESEVHAEPGGIGISIAAGEILDPIEDMTERVSDVLVTAIVSLRSSETYIRDRHIHGAEITCNYNCVVYNSLLDKL